METEDSVWGPRLAPSFSLIGQQCAWIQTHTLTVRSRCPGVSGALAHARGVQASCRRCMSRCHARGVRVSCQGCPGIMPEVHVQVSCQGCPGIMPEVHVQVSCQGCPGIMPGVSGYHAGGVQVSCWWCPGVMPVVSRCHAGGVRVSGVCVEISAEVENEKFAQFC